MPKLMVVAGHQSDAESTMPRQLPTLARTSLHCCSCRCRCCCHHGSCCQGCDANLVFVWGTPPSFRHWQLRWSSCRGWFYYCTFFTSHCSQIDWKGTLILASPVFLMTEGPPRPILFSRSPCLLQRRPQHPSTRQKWNRSLVVCHRQWCNWGLLLSSLARPVLSQAAGQSTCTAPVLWLSRKDLWRHFCSPFVVSV